MDYQHVIKYLLVTFRELALIELHIFITWIIGHILMYQQVLKKSSKLHLWGLCGYGADLRFSSLLKIKVALAGAVQFHVKDKGCISGGFLFFPIDGSSMLISFVGASDFFFFRRKNIQGELRFSQFQGQSKPPTLARIYNGITDLLLVWDSWILTHVMQFSLVEGKPSQPNLRWLGTLYFDLLVVNRYPK